MSHSHTTHRMLAADFLGLLFDGAASLAAKIQQNRKQAHTRKVLGELTEQQLKDIGVERSAVSPSRPAVEVPAGLMDKLMAMR